MLPELGAAQYIMVMPVIHWPRRLLHWPQLPHLSAVESVYP